MGSMPYALRINYIYYICLTRRVYPEGLQAYMYTPFLDVIVM